MHRGKLLKVWAAFGPHVSEEQCTLRSVFPFISFPVKGKRGAYPSASSPLPLTFLAYYTALTYQKQDAFLYCQPFHLKCKLILTQCALMEIKVGTLTFLSPLLVTGGQGWVPKGQERGGQGEEIWHCSPRLSSGLPSSGTWSISVACAPCVNAPH